VIDASWPTSAIFDGVAARIHTSDTPTRSLAVMSSLHGEGTTTIALGLALSLTGYDSSAVLLIDANWIRPVLSENADRLEAAGLAECLRGERSLNETVVPAARKGLSLLPAGDFGAEPPPLGRLSAFLAGARASFGKVVIDLPPVLVAPALVVPWTKMVDQSYLVVRRGATPIAVIRRALAEIGSERSPHLVLNRTRVETAGWASRRAG